MNDGSFAMTDPRAAPVDPPPSAGTRRFRRSIQGLVPISAALVVPTPATAHQTIADPDAPRPSDHPTPRPSALVAPVRLVIDINRDNHVDLVFRHFNTFFSGRSLIDLVRMGEALGAWRQSSAMADKEALIIGTVTRLMHGLDLEVPRDDLRQLLLKFLDPTRLHAVAQTDLAKR